MANIKDIHIGVFNLFQNLIPKEIIIKFPNSDSCPVVALKGKKFKFLNCITSTIDKDRLKQLDEAYSDEAIEVTLFEDVILETLDTGGTIQAPDRSYKLNNASILYKGLTYAIKSEIYGEFDNSIRLICDRKS